MIKILHIGMSAGIGGIETFVMSLYRKIDRTKVQFDFLATGDIAYEEEIKALGGKVYKITPRRESYFKHYFEMKAFFEEHKEYRYIHQHVINSSYILPLKFPLPNTKKIVHSHRAGKEKNIRIAIFNLLNHKKMIEKSDILLACSQEAGAYIFKDEQFTVVPNSIDTSLYAFHQEVRQSIRESLGFTNELVVGHVGRLTYAKNHRLLFQIFAHIKNQHKNAVLVLAGDGELKEELKEYAKQLKISESVHFLGARSDVHQLLQGMDIFIFPSHYEGLGTAVIEAQATGLKCYVSSEVPKEVDITQQCSFFSIQEQPQRIAENILNTYAEQSSDERIQLSTIVANSKFDIEVLVRLFEKIYAK